MGNWGNYGGYNNPYAYSVPGYGALLFSCCSSQPWKSYAPEKIPTRLFWKKGLLYWGSLLLAETHFGHDLELQTAVVAQERQTVGLVLQMHGVEVTVTGWSQVRQLLWSQESPSQQSLAIPATSSQPWVEVNWIVSSNLCQIDPNCVNPNSPPGHALLPVLHF